MQVKKKGRLNPCPPSYKDPNSVFKLFPVAILALASALPPHDQEVLAYMITRSIVSSTSFPFQSKHKRRNGNRFPQFECGCFDCYTRFWHRWDSSPNRDLIHQVIEVFEDHLVQNEAPKKHCKASGKKDKVAESEGLVEAENRGGTDEVAAVAGGGGGSRKGLARKFLPGVVGLFNSRVWSLWGPDI
ncbi:hypothetical protein GQ457_11G029030 [Hibiscus cannabinus]